MTEVLIHDSGRSGKLGWAARMLQEGQVVGFVASPWESPPTTQPRRPSAREIVTSLMDIGGTVLFDPETYGVFVQGANQRATYDSWGLWPNGQPSKDRPAILAHVDRVAEVQHELGVPFLAPGLCLESPVGLDADRTLEAFDRMRSVIGGGGWTASVVGTPAFWSAGPELDAFVGQIATMKPERCLLAVLRASGRYPWTDLTPEEVTGVCRTATSLSLHMPVVAGRSDFAGLPAVAAGAASIGTGWDLKQRVLSGDLFRADPGIRRQSQRVSHSGLLASLKRREAEQLRAGDASLSTALVPGPLPIDFNGHWRHHLAVLANAARVVGSQATARDRVRSLAASYKDAADAFAVVARHARPLEASASQWIEPLAQGLREYAESEGL